MFPKGYIGSTLSELEHVYSNWYFVALHMHDGFFEPEVDLDTDIKRLKNGFMAGLQRAIDKKLPSYKGVTGRDIQGMMDLATEIDWMNEQELKRIAKVYNEIQERIKKEQ
jgi:hypothetical protein